MNVQTSSGRVAIHFAAWMHRPKHASFHLRGIGRELHQTGADSLALAFGWVALWMLILL
jgi:hypothetical protein